MFTEKALKNANNCRFCWMCRHTCPVGLVTGKEGNNARAKGLLVSMDHRNMPLNKDSAKLMYECCLCKACTNNCETGFDPSIYILEARTKAVAEDLIPAEVQRAAVRAEAGKLGTSCENEKLSEKIAGLPKTAENVLYLGESSRCGMADIAFAVMELLDKAKIDYTVLAEEPASGAQFGELIGYVDEVRKMAQNCGEALLKTGAGNIIALNPTDAAFMKHQWEEWGILKAEVVTATAFMETLIAEKRLQPKKLGISAAYHDPCRLARDLDETEPTRNIMAAMGIDLHELFLNRKLTKCCGGAVLRQTFPTLQKEVAEARWGDVALEKMSLLITACPCCYENMKVSAPEGMEIKDLFVLLNRACERPL